MYQRQGHQRQSSDSCGLRHAAWHTAQSSFLLKSALTCCGPKFVQQYLRTRVYELPTFALPQKRNLDAIVLRVTSCTGRTIIKAGRGGLLHPCKTTFCRHLQRRFEQVMPPSLLIHLVSSCASNYKNSVSLLPNFLDSL